MSKSKAYDKAAAKVPNTDVSTHLEVEHGGHMMTVTSQEEALEILSTSDGVTAFDPLRFVKAAKIEGGKVAEKFGKLLEGQQLEGWLVSKGEVEIEDINTKLPKMVARYGFELTSGARISLLETTQLKALDALPADGSARVLIANAGETRTSKGRIMSQYYIVHWLNDRKPLVQLAAASAAASAEADGAIGP
jgi:hypothetical protein